MSEKADFNIERPKRVPTFHDAYRNGLEFCHEYFLISIAHFHNFELWNIYSILKQI